MAQPLNPMPPVGSHREEDREMDVAQCTLFSSECSLAFYFPFYYDLALCLCLRFCCFALLGDLAKAMVTPTPGEMPSIAGLDLAWVRLGAAPWAPLLAGGAGPSDHGQADGEGLTGFDR